MPSLAGLYAVKLHEQVERSQHLIGLVPPDHLEWRPTLPEGAGAPPLRIAQILDHLQQSLAGIAASLYAVENDRHGRLLALRTLGESPPPVTGAEWQLRMATFGTALAAEFSRLPDADLARIVPTLLSPAGEALLTLLLGNLEHFINHKYQLFFYLKLLGIAAVTSDLYRLR